MTGPHPYGMSIFQPSDFIQTERTTILYRRNQKMSSAPMGDITTPEWAGQHVSPVCADARCIYIRTSIPYFHAVVKEKRTIGIGHYF